MSNGANSIHKKLRHDLEDYIKAQYFGKSPLLLSAVGQHLDDEGLLYQKPFIESSPAYKSVKDGIQKAKIPAIGKICAKWRCWAGKPLVRRSKMRKQPDKNSSFTPCADIKICDILISIYYLYACVRSRAGSRQEICPAADGKTEKIGEFLHDGRIAAYS